jgi:NADH-quinone oxidoreductase subunit N
MLMLTELDLRAVLPVLIVTGTALFILILGLFTRTVSFRICSAISVLGVLGAVVAAGTQWGSSTQAFSGAILIDDAATFFQILLGMVTFFAILLSVGYFERWQVGSKEYSMLLLLGLAGMMVMVSSVELITIILGLELLSVCLYVLAGYAKQDIRSVEASLKYFFFGAFSTGFLLYGVAFLYGATGSTHLTHISDACANGTYQGSFLAVGIGLFILGFAFKIASVPFHMWAPDVYEGSPTSVTALMIAGVKASAFVPLCRMLYYAVPIEAVEWRTVLEIVAILSMVVGNVAAIAQKNIKRMLAYSSIAHAGYLLVAVIARGTLGLSSLMFYLVAYALMNLGAFGVVIALGKKEKENLLFASYAGLGFRHPWIAFAMTVFMFSLAGVPPTAGFIGKFYIFSAAVKSGYVGLAVLGVLASVISAYFYLRVVVTMYMKKPEGDVAEHEPSFPLGATVIATAVATVFLGVFPASVLRLVETAASSFL